MESSGHQRLPIYGRGKDWARVDVERLFRKLVIDGVLAEDLVVTAAEHTACYIKVGTRALPVLDGRNKV